MTARVETATCLGASAQGTIPRLDNACGCAGPGTEAGRSKVAGGLTLVLEYGLTDRFKARSSVWVAWLPASEGGSGRVPPPEPRETRFRLGRRDVAWVPHFSVGVSRTTLNRRDGAGNPHPGVPQGWRGGPASSQDHSHPGRISSNKGEGE